MLAMKYHFSAGRAIRLGVGGNAATAEDGSLFQGGISMQGQYLAYPWPNREINFYIGSGPRVAHVIHRREESNDFDAHRTVWEFGVTGRLGVEWFVMESLSFLGEYGNELSIRLENRDVADEERTLRDYLYRSSAKLGISAYF